MSLTERQIRDQVWQGAWKTKNRAPTDEDYSYWIRVWPDLEARAIEVKDLDYAVKRLLGWRAAGADVPPYGEYANPPTAYMPVPPSPWTDPPAPGTVDPPVVDPPAETDTAGASDNVFATIHQALERIVANTDKLATMDERIVSILEQINARGVRVRF